MTRQALVVEEQYAHVTGWTPPGFSGVLWCSPLRLAGKPLRGGIPVCWPWFGPHPSDPKRPQHGYARQAPWTPASSGTKAFHLTRAACAGFDPEHQLEAALTVSASNATLSLTLTTTNVGAAPAQLSLALHSYFAVSDTAQVTVEGLDGARYRDNTRGGAWATQLGVLRVPAETIALFDDAPALQTIFDPGLGRRIDIRRPGAGSTIVWNPGANASTMADIPPGEERRFLCVESGCIGTRAVTLAPGDQHRLDVEISVATL